MELNGILNNGIENITKTAKRFYSKSIKGNAFMLKTASSIKKSAKIRAKFENEGTHIPPFLIASITSSCNLKCAGCYSNAFNCGTEKENLKAGEWGRIFDEAAGLGISFIFLAGGEPLLRKDIIEKAAQVKNIIFPVFTNGTMIDKEYLELFDSNRNLVPVLSIEGTGETTDLRRGSGISQKIENVMRQLKEQNILYGVSITVTSLNKNEVSDPGFVRNLRHNGCGVIFYVEYVPAEKGTENLVLSQKDLTELQTGIDKIRSDNNFVDTVILSFPGDEEALGGCLAAGRGFFHINASGGAEPCPFSPCSVVNLKNKTLLDAIKSPFFEKVQKLNTNPLNSYSGGCSLFNQKIEVEKLKK